jgi:hypothetical protein
MLQYYIDSINFFSFLRTITQKDIFYLASLKKSSSFIKLNLPITSFSCPGTWEWKGAGGVLPHPCVVFEVFRVKLTAEQHVGKFLTKSRKKLLVPQV